MNGPRTIWEAASEALNRLGGSGSIPDILDQIVSDDLYQFGTEAAEHVLETEIKRKCGNSNRTDKSGTMLFEVEEGIYRLLKMETRVMSDSKTSGIKRIHRARDKEEIITALMSDQVGVFKEIWRLLLFAAQLGYQHGRREPLASIDSGKGIDQSTFGSCPSWPGVCYLMGLVEERSSDALSGSAEAEDLRLTVFQEYANGGLSILQDHFHDRVRDLDSLLTFVDEQSKKSVQSVDLNLAI